MWISRDKNGSLKLWSSKPNRVAPPTNIPSEPIPTIWANGGFSMPLSKNTWEELTWEDEPMEVELEVVPQPIKPDEYFDEGDMIELESMGIGYRVDGGFIYN